MSVNPRSCLVAVVILLTAALAGCGAAPGQGTPATSDSTGLHSSQASPTNRLTTQAPPSTSAASAGSSASPPAGISSASSAVAHSGHATPADAVDRFYQALLASNFPLACSYVVEGEPCAGSVSGHETGNFTIGKTEVSASGVYALVEVTGRICGTGAGCVINSNPSAGMPTGSETVQQAWAASVVTGNSFAPTRAEQSPDAGWYVDLTGGTD